MSLIVLFFIYRKSYLNLIYDTRFHLVINDSKYTAPDWDPTKTFWRDADDNYVEELIAPIKKVITK